MISTEPFIHFLRRMSPEVADRITPLLIKTLAAWEDGHAFACLDETETQTARHATPLVKENAIAPLVLSRNRLFLGKVWAMEQDCAQQLMRLTQNNTLPKFNYAPFLNEYFPDPNSSEQQQAAALALLHPFLLINGGPGTGKTTTVAKILALLCCLRENLPRIALTAPTGKAAAHLQQSLTHTLTTFRLPERIRMHLTALSGQTLHRILGIAPPLMKAHHNAHTPLPYEIIVADEASMIDLSLMHKLLSATGTGSRLILLGDENQLPAVGAGAVLSALSRQTILSPAESSLITTWLPENTLPVAEHPPPLSSSIARLTISRRFGANSAIGQLARAVATNHPDVITYFDHFPQQLSLRQRDPGIFTKWYKTQADYWQAVLDNNIQAAFTHFYHSMVLSVLKDDAKAFNHGYLKFLQQQGHGKGYFYGRALIMTRNNPILGVYNGDIGIILKDKEYDKPIIYFPEGNGFRRIDIGRLGAHEDAFALTVHKSQGSEYREVLLIMPASTMPDFFDRALLYTAITRAKERLVCLGSAECFTAAVRNQHHRRSALGEFLSVKQHSGNRRIDASTQLSVQ